jgi:hypothetical protein
MSKTFEGMDGAERFIAVFSLRRREAFADGSNCKAAIDDNKRLAPKALIL